MAIAGHVSKRMLEHYRRIRTDAKRAALDAIAQGPKQAFSFRSPQVAAAKAAGGLEADPLPTLNFVISLVTV
jgi:hypothetical protein